MLLYTLLCLVVIWIVCINHPCTYDCVLYVSIFILVRRTAYERVRSRRTRYAAGAPAGANQHQQTQIKALLSAFSVLCLRLFCADSLLSAARFSLTVNTFVLHIVEIMSLVLHSSVSPDFGHLPR